MNHNYPMNGGTYPRTRHVLAHAREGHKNMILIGALVVMLILVLIAVIVIAVQTRPTNRAIVNSSASQVSVQSRGTPGAVSAVVNTPPSTMWVSTVDKAPTKGAMPPLLGIQGQGFQTQAHRNLATGPHTLFVALIDGENVGDVIATHPFQLWNVNGKWEDSGTGLSLAFSDANDGEGTVGRTDCSTGAVEYGLRTGAELSSFQDTASGTVQVGNVIEYTDGSGGSHTLVRTSINASC